MKYARGIDAPDCVGVYFVFQHRSGFVAQALHHGKLLIDTAGRPQYLLEGKIIIACPPLIAYCHVKDKNHHRSGFGALWFLASFIACSYKQQNIQEEEQNACSKNPLRSAMRSSSMHRGQAARRDPAHNPHDTFVFGLRFGLNVGKFNGLTNED